MGKVTKKKLEKYGWVDSPASEEVMRHPNFENTHIFYTWNPYHPSVTCKGKDFTICPTMKQLKSYVLKETGEEMVKLESKEQLEKKLRNVGFVGNYKDYFVLEYKDCIKIRVCTDIKDFTCFSGGSDWQSFKNFKDLRKQVKKITGIDIKKQGKEDKVTAKLLERNCFELHKEDSKEKGCEYYDVSINGEFLRIKLGTNKYCTYTKETEDVCEWDIHKLESKEDLKDLIFKVYGISLGQLRRHKAAEIATNVIKNATGKALKDISGNGNHFISKENSEPSWEVESLPTVWGLEGSNYSYINGLSMNTIWNIEPDSTEHNTNVFPQNDNYARAMQALPQLLVMRDVYRQGWVPDWSENNQKGIACIIKKSGKVVGNENFSWYAFLSFQTAEIRDKFLKCFRPQIEDYFAMF